ncbi:MAG: zf-HC2 domain-containing protein [Candidatus Aminicenantes bacterium]|nr:zf-HC2 domain-containing protein [Candidatus Aminicenantes bacterium]
MKCSKAKKLINDYIDGQLSDSLNLQVEHHLEHCSGCQKVLKDLQKIISVARNLEEHSPSAGTWMAIQQRLDAQKRPSEAFVLQRKERSHLFSFSPALRYGLSAAFVMFILAGVVFFSFLYRNGRLGFHLKKDQKYTLAKLSEAEHHYQSAIKALMEAVSAQEETIDPELAEVFRHNLELIDTSINACKQAVLQHPDNMEVQNYLLASYRKKLDLLDEAIAVRPLSFNEKELKTII